jgi:hypothetical protein
MACACHPKLHGRLRKDDSCKNKKNFGDPISMEKSWEWWHSTCHPSKGGKPKIGELWSRPAWAESKTLSSK